MAISVPLSGRVALPILYILHLHGPLEELPRCLPKTRKDSRRKDSAAKIPGWHPAPSLLILYHV